MERFCLTSAFERGQSVRSLQAVSIITSYLAAAHRTNETGGSFNLRGKDSSRPQRLPLIVRLIDSSRIHPSVKYHLCYWGPWVSLPPTLTSEASGVTFIDRLPFFSSVGLSHFIFGGFVFLEEMQLVTCCVEDKPLSRFSISDNRPEHSKNF